MQVDVPYTVSHPPQSQTVVGRIADATDGTPVIPRTGGADAGAAEGPAIASKAAIGESPDVTAAAGGTPDAAPPTYTLAQNTADSGPAKTGAAPAAGKSFWVYRNGVFNWGGDYSSSAKPNYKSKAGEPESGRYDIAVTLTSQWGIWAPYAGGKVRTWDFDAARYNYLTLDLKPTVAGQKWQLYFVQVHDVAIVGADGKRIVIDPANYGPSPVPGVWATYKIPLSTVLTQYSSGKPVYENHVYKFGLQDETGLSQNTWYVDNVGFVE